MASIEDYINQDLKKQSFEFNFGKLLLRTLQTSVKTSVYMDEIIRKQIELKSLLDNKVHDKEAIEEEVLATFQALNSHVEKEYLSLLAQSMNHEK